ncbi:MAG: phosphatase PAP2 family protein, partial [Nanoarchaeota archaeon]
LFKLTFLSLILIYLITFAIRFIYYKPRPKKQSHKNLLEKLDASSFPSMHSARITLLCLIFTSVYLNLYSVLLSALLILLVSYSRIYLKKHYFSDLVGGVILGILVYFFMNYFN